MSCFYVKEIKADEIDKWINYFERKPTYLNDLRRYQQFLRPKIRYVRFLIRKKCTAFGSHAPRRPAAPSTVELRVNEK